MLTTTIVLKTTGITMGEMVKILDNVHLSEKNVQSIDIKFICKPEKKKL
jgi:hypothetical protein